MSVPNPANRPVGELTSEAAELIRVATQAAQLFEHSAQLTADQVSDTVSALHALTADLPQLLNRLATFLSSEQAAGRLTGGSPHITEIDLLRIARDTREHLGEAGRIAVALSEALALTKASASLIGKPWNTGTAGAEPGEE